MSPPTEAARFRDRPIANARWTMDRPGWMAHYCATDHMSYRPCQKAVPTDAALLILDPRLFAAVTLEHADCPTGDGIEHAHNLRGFLAAGFTRLDRIWIKTGKNFVLKIAGTP